MAGLHGPLPSEVWREHLGRHPEDASAKRLYQQALRREAHAVPPAASDTGRGQDRGRVEPVEYIEASGFTQDDVRWAREAVPSGWTVAGPPVDGRWAFRVNLPDDLHFGEGPVPQALLDLTKAFIASGCHSVQRVATDAADRDLCAALAAATGKDPREGPSARHGRIWRTPPGPSSPSPD